MEDAQTYRVKYLPAWQEVESGLCPWGPRYTAPPVCVPAHQLPGTYPELDIEHDQEAVFTHGVFLRFVKKKQL
jgi:hypothetical protein